MLPTPATTSWFMSSRPTGLRERRTPRENSSRGSASPSAAPRIGSGPRRASTARFSSRVTTSHAVGPVRSATACSPTSRTRTAPRGGGGDHAPSATGAAAPAGTVSRSPTRRRGAPIACTTAALPSPANVHAPYRPRCTRSQRSGARAPSGAKPRKSCLPQASLATRTCPSRSAAPAANRPCGLLTPSGCPVKSSPNARASRWTVWPSGTSGGRAARRLVGGELVDPALVARVAAERLGEERVDELDGLVDRVLARADGDDVRVVVLAPQAGRVEVPRERGAHAGHLVRGDLLAVARPPDDDAERARLRDDRLARGEAERRVVVEGVELVGPVVHDVVARGLEVLDEVGLELVAGVIGGDVNAHGPHHAAGGPPAVGARP